MLRRLLQSLWPSRVLTTLSRAIHGARVHPSARLLGKTRRIHLARGSKVSQLVQLDCGNTGTIRLAERVWLAPSVDMTTSGIIDIGAGTTIQKYTAINGNVRIGRGCIIAPSVFISSGTHPFRHRPELPIRAQETLLPIDAGDRPVRIDDDCWLGVHAVIAPGVRIGKGCVVGANAVVTGDCAPYSVAAGGPARPLSPRLAWLPPKEIDASRIEHSPYFYSGFEIEYGGEQVQVRVCPGIAAVIAVPWDCSEVCVTLVATRPALMLLGRTAPVEIAEGRNTIRLTELIPAFGNDEKARFREAEFTLIESAGCQVRVLGVSSTPA